MLTITQCPSPNYSLRGILKPEFIIIHAAMGTLAGTTATFLKSSSKVSAHYIIGRDGSIVQYVQEQFSAWHAMAINSRSIGIEHEDMFFDAQKRLIGGCMSGLQWVTANQFNNSAELVAGLMKKYNIPVTKVLGHNDPYLRQFGNNHLDPGPTWPWQGYRQKLIELSKLSEVAMEIPGDIVETLVHNKGGRPRKAPKTF
jgi:N-acetylmuramoyl-L-alanine amidase